MYTFKGRPIKQNLSINTYVCPSSGETVYMVCDHVGLVFSTIFESRLERFFLETA